MMTNGIGRRFVVATVMVMMAMFGFTQVNTVAAQSTGTLTVATTSDPAGLTGFYYYGGLGEITQDDGQSTTGSVTPGTINVYQSLPLGFALDIDCGAAPATLIDNGKGVAVDVADGDDVTCTFHNRDVGATITVVNESVSAESYSYYGDIGQFSLSDGESSSVSNKLPGDYNIYQSVPYGQALSVACTGASFTEINNGVTVSVPESGDVICTFTNSDVGGSISITNVSDTGVFDYYGALNGSASNGETLTAANLLEGEYSIGQVVPAGYILNITCDAPNVVINTNNLGINQGITANLAVNEDVSCTFENVYVGGSITVVAAGDAADDLFNYYGAFGIITGSIGTVYTREDLYPGDYDLYQSIPAGFELDINCVGADTTPINAQGLTVNLDANEDVICTFDNSDVGGSITVIAAGDASGDPFNYYGAFGIINGSIGTVYTREDLYPGDYDIYQSIPAGFELDITCVGGDTTPINAQGLTVNLDANEDVICTFTNSDVGSSITLIVETIPSGMTGLEYYGSFGIFSLDDGERQSYEGLYAGEYQLFQNIPADYNLSISCPNATVLESEDGKGVTITLDANEDITCTFTTSAIVTELLVNGDFEAGQFEGWNEHSRNGYDLVVHNDRYQYDIPALSGDWKAWLGGGRYEKSYLWQEATIPAGQTTILEFNYQIISNDWCGYDYLMVYVHDGQRYYRIAGATMCRRTSYGDWRAGRVNLSYFEGQTVNIMFYAYNDSHYTSSFFLDDVALAVSNVSPQNATMDVPAIVGDLDDATVIDQDVATMAGETTPQTRTDDDSIPTGDVRSNVPTAVALSKVGTEQGMLMIPVVMLPLLVLVTGVVATTKRRND